MFYNFSVMLESARIARGAVKPLSELTVDSADAVVFPGGFGAACALANSFRVSDDIKPCRGETGLITDIASAALKFAGPGCYLDLDSLEVGVDHGCPNEGASTTASNELTYKNWKAQLALWVRFGRPSVLSLCNVPPDYALHI